jgi:FkbM family methyltransferase
MIDWLAKAARLVRRRLLKRRPASSKVARLFDQKAAVVVQVGSNDGCQGDPIAELTRHNPKWYVMFIEPLPHIFRRLRANYPSSPKYRFENIAIADKKGHRRLYFISDEIKTVTKNIPFWYDQLGSFDKSHILKHQRPLELSQVQLESFIASESVCCEPLREVLERNWITTVDLLHIDAEGYDYEIIKQVDFDASPPKAILYEHTHLSSDDKRAAKRLLSSAGYRLRSDDRDTLAIRRSGVSAAIARLRRLAA